MKLTSFSPSSLSSLGRKSAWAALGAAALACLSACSPADEEEAAAGEAWVGKTYVLQIPSSHWISPRGVGDDIGPFVPLFLVRVDSAKGSTLDVTIGTAQQDMTTLAITQEMCGPTTKLTGMSAGFPAATIGPADLPVYLRNGDIAVNATIRGISFENLLPDGVTPPGDMTGVVHATMDFREAVPLLTLLPDKTADGACMALSQAEMVPCEPCPQDGTLYCLALTADDLGAVEYTGAPMVDVPANACANMVPQPM